MREKRGILPLCILYVFFNFKISVKFGKYSLPLFYIKIKDCYIFVNVRISDSLLKVLQTLTDAQCASLRLINNFLIVKRAVCCFDFEIASPSVRNDNSLHPSILVRSLRSRKNGCGNLAKFYQFIRQEQALALRMHINLCRERPVCRSNKITTISIVQKPQKSQYNACGTV